MSSTSNVSRPSDLELIQMALMGNLFILGFTFTTVTFGIEFALPISLLLLFHYDQLRNVKEELKEVKQQVKDLKNDVDEIYQELDEEEDLDQEEDQDEEEDLEEDQADSEDQDQDQVPEEAKKNERPEVKLLILAFSLMIVSIGILTKEKFFFYTIGGMISGVIITIVINTLIECIGVKESKNKKDQDKDKNEVPTEFWIMLDALFIAVFVIAISTKRNMFFFMFGGMFSSLIVTVVMKSWNKCNNVGVQQVKGSEKDQKDQEDQDKDQKPKEKETKKENGIPKEFWIVMAALHFSVFVLIIWTREKSFFFVLSELVTGTIITIGMKYLNECVGAEKQVKESEKDQKDQDQDQKQKDKEAKKENRSPGILWDVVALIIIVIVMFSIGSKTAFLRSMISSFVSCLLTAFVMKFLSEQSWFKNLGEQLEGLGKKANELNEDQKDQAEEVDDFEMVNME